MILALLLTVQQLKTDVEVAPPIVPGVVTVEALMRLPKAGPRERAEFEVIADALLDDTEEYGHRQLVKLTVGSGDTVRCDLLPDCLRVRFGVLESDTASIIPLLNNIVHNSEFREETVSASIATLPFRRHDYWASALEPELLNYRQVQVSDLATLYRVMGRPENLTVTFAASSPLGATLVDAWRSTVAGWQRGPNAFPPDQTSPKPAFERRGKLTTIVLRGRPISATDPSLTTKLCALFALGGGKDSAVWKSLRESLGWSYRQEALLRNSPDGFEPVIEVVTLHSDSDLDRTHQVRPALEKAVAAWTDADKRHAVAAAEALFHRGIGLDPLYFKSTRPASDDPLFMETYWRFKTGLDWRPNVILAAMESVDTKAMQAAAMAMLEGAGVELIRGTG